MSTATGFLRPLAMNNGPYGHVRVYEEVPGSITISFSRDGSTWTAISIPPEAASIVTFTIAEAMHNRSHPEEIPR